MLARTPVKHFVAGISAGIIDDAPMLDLPYSEDSRAMVDLNCVMNELGRSSNCRVPVKAGLLRPQSSKSWWSCAPRVAGADPEGKGYSGGGTVMKFVLASHNQGKLAEMRAFWASWGWR
ncbi:MAG: hypothetical protein ACLUIX_08805 [Oscillospiraceae bacterium]